MDDDLCVSLAFKVIALLCQLLPQLQVIFDNAIVNDSKFSVVAGMGMGVDVRWRAVGCPAGVADAGGARKKRAVRRLFTQTGNAAHDLADGDGLVLNHRNSGGVIAPVFQLFQSFQQNGSRVLTPGISHNSAHNEPP